MNILYVSCMSEGMQLAILTSHRGGLGCTHMTGLSIPILYHSHDSFILLLRHLSMSAWGPPCISPLLMLVSDGLDYQCNAVYYLVQLGSLTRQHQP